jgi:hypothetical protein
VSKTTSTITGIGLAFILTALTLQPAAVSQESSALGNRHELAVQELIRISISSQYLEDVYVQGASQASLAFQSSIQPTLGRALTDAEKQRLYMFWYRKTKEMMPYEVLEQMLIPIYMRTFTLDEVEKINEFYHTPAGARLVQLTPTLIREAENAGTKLASELTSNREWMNSTLEELRTEFPYWFPNQ